MKLVCIDNLITAMDAVTQNDNLYLAQSNFVGTLKKIAMRYDVAILLVAHPRKTRDGFSNDDVSGSSDITNKADVVLSYERIEHDDYESKLLITITRRAQSAFTAILLCRGITAGSGCPARHTQTQMSCRFEEAL